MAKIILQGFYVFMMLPVSRCIAMTEEMGMDVIFDPSLLSYALQHPVDVKAV